MTLGRAIRVPRPRRVLLGAAGRRRLARRGSADGSTVRWRAQRRAARQHPGDRTGPGAAGGALAPAWRPWYHRLDGHRRRHGDGPVQDSRLRHRRRPAGPGGRDRRITGDHVAGRLRQFSVFWTLGAALDRRPRAGAACCRPMPDLDADWRTCRWSGCWCRPRRPARGPRRGRGSAGADKPGRIGLRR